MSGAYLSDLALSRRLERAEAEACAGFVEARARLSPESGAEWMETAGAYAMFDGPRSPITQTFGLGLFAPAAAADLDRIEAFFGERGAPTMHEVSPMADKALFPMLTGRGYRPIEFTQVMHLPLAGWTPGWTPAGEAPGVTARLAQTDADRELWARTCAEGWRELEGLADLMLDLGRVVAARRGSLAFLAEIEGVAVAAGALSIHGGVALLAGAATIPEYRKRGAQRALLEARLAHARAAGCDLAMFCAEPGSASARNGERRGFRIAYTRIKWEKTA